MTTSQLLCVGAFLMAYHYTILRTFNTLGLRLFSLFFFAAVAVGYGWYADYREVRTMQQQGITTQAVVVGKAANSLRVRFTDPAGRWVERTQTGGLAGEELERISKGQPTAIRYNPHSGRFYLASSYQRRLRENGTGYGLLLPGILVVLGVLCWIAFRNYRVLAHQGTMYEYLTDAGGAVVLGDTRASLTTARSRAGALARRVSGFADPKPPGTPDASGQRTWLKGYR